METKISRPGFDHTVGVLVKAYLNGTLLHGSCYACAVGNIVAHGLGVKIKNHKWENMPYPSLIDGQVQGWGAVFVSDFDQLLSKKTQLIREENLSHPRVIEQISATGYSWQDLAKIEYAFEVDFDERCEDGDRMFAGLMAVVDVLADIHGVDLSIKDQAKKLFLKTV